MKRKKPDVLVLNRNFIPIHIVEWKRAMSLMFQDAARGMDREYIPYENFVDWMEFSNICGDDYPTVLTANSPIAVPEIIVLRKYDRLPIRDVKYSRQTLFQRDKFICGYCGVVFRRGELTVDHIIPRAQGGKSTWMNTIAACFSCNHNKADRTPEQAGLKLRHKPRKPSWISPLSDIGPEHPCKSWSKYSNRMLTE